MTALPLPLAGILTVLVAAQALAADHLASRPLPVGAPDRVLTVGDSLRTPADQALRVRLPDRSLLYVRAGSTLTLKSAGQLDLDRGEVFVETAAGQPALTIRTPRRRLQAADSRFLVRAAGAGTSVAVASGRVEVSGVDEPVRGGQWLSEKADRPERAPRLSHLAAWTRPLRQAASLVPASAHTGGALVARDPDDQEVHLELRRYQVDVHIEDGFARTTVDLTYFNHHLDRLEGTFLFPLPPDASLSRLAMYVDGRLMEGGMAERDHARASYETIVWEKRDPALLEWLDGSTFKMRIFPLEPRQEKRLLLGYTQRLNGLSGQLGYGFPTGHWLRQVRQWSFHARVKGGAGLEWQCDSHTLKASREGADLLLDSTAKDARLDRDVSLSLREKTTDPVRFSSMRQDGFDYLLLRYRPELPATKAMTRRAWVVLAETSGDRDPLLARTQIELIRSLLAHAGRDDTFVVLTGGTRTRALRPRAVRNDLTAIDETMSELEKAHLVGAFDLGAALTAARPFLEAAKDPYLVHVGSGIPAMGERRPAELLKRLPRGVRYVGVGVGRRWERALMRTLAERTSGYFTQVNPDEELSWRGLDLAETLATPRLLDVRVSDPAGKATFLPFSRLVSQGEELAAVARFQGEAPAKVRVRGLLEGREFVRDIEVKDVRDRAAYLPRSWAKLQIERLLAEDASKHKADIVELSKRMYVMTPFTSLLVLENDDMYTRFKVDRGRKDHWALYPAPAKIKVVIEPLEGDAGDPKKGIKPPKRVVLSSVIVRGVPAVLARGASKNVEEAQRRQNAIARLRLLMRTFETVATFNRTTTALTDVMGEEESTASGFDKASLPQRDTMGGTARPRGDEVTTQQLEEIAGVWGRLSARDRTRALRVLARGGVTIKEATRPVATRVVRPVPIPRGTATAAATATTALGYEELGPVFPNVLLRDADPMTLPAPESREPPANIPLAVAGAAAGETASAERGSEPSARPTLLYSRPAYTGDTRLFLDLLSYAPGLNTTPADLRAVLEAEARPDPASRPGTVAPQARALIDRARQPAWRTLVLPAQGLAPAYRIHFDGAGRYAWQRTLDNGLREQVLCDGKVLWHLYPELHLAARRVVSRHHRLAFSASVPLCVPPADDLARGADLQLLDQQTVAVVPHGARGGRKHVRLHLLFTKEGALAERRQVEMPAGKTVRREIYSPDGTWKVLDAAGKEVHAVQGKIGKAEAALLKPDLKKLVVLALPFRTQEHVIKAFELDKRRDDKLTNAEIRALLSAGVAEGRVGDSRFADKRMLYLDDPRHLGTYALLAASERFSETDKEADKLANYMLANDPNEPLAHYLALHSSPVLRTHASRWAASSNIWGDGFLRRLGLGHSLCLRWSSGKTLGATAAQHRAERQQALAYLKQYRGSELAWALLGLMLDRTAEIREEAQRKSVYRELARACELFEGAPGLAGLARYEQARCLWRAGRADEARRRFTSLYRAARDRGRLLRVDGDFRTALLGAKEGWADLLRETAGEMLARKQPASVLLLARQCWELDDQVMSRRLLEKALGGMPVAGKAGLALYQEALSWLLQTDQRDEADRLLRKLLADERHARQAPLWRQAAELATQRRESARALECLEKALALEYAHLPDTIDLVRVRQDYRSLLKKYAELTEALATLKLPIPAGFRDRVVRAADRWRSLDREQAEACKLAAGVLRGLGEGELAFDYLTTPVALRSGEADVWVGLAGELVGWGERDLADRAYRSAFERESSNAQILWDRAENLRRAGRLARARGLYRQLAEGDWQPRFASLQTQARWMLEGQ